MKTVRVAPEKIETAGVAERAAFGWDVLKAADARMVRFAAEMRLAGEL